MRVGGSAEEAWSAVDKRTAESSNRSSLSLSVNVRTGLQSSWSSCVWEQICGRAVYTIPGADPRCNRWYPRCGRPFNSSSSSSLIRHDARLQLVPALSGHSQTFYADIQSPPSFLLHFMCSNFLPSSHYFVEAWIQRHIFGNVGCGYYGYKINRTRTYIWLKIAAQSMCIITNVTKTEFTKLSVKRRREELNTLALGDKQNKEDKTS